MRATICNLTLLLCPDTSKIKPSESHTGTGYVATWIHQSGPQTKLFSAEKIHSLIWPLSWIDPDQWELFNETILFLQWVYLAIHSQSNGISRANALESLVITLSVIFFLQPALQFAKDTWLRVTSSKKKAHIMHEFSESLESAHGGPHVSVCGNGLPDPKCAISLGNHT